MAALPSRHPEHSPDRHRQQQLRGFGQRRQCQHHPGQRHPGRGCRLCPATTPSSNVVIQTLSVNPTDSLTIGGVIGQVANSTMGLAYNLAQPTAAGLLILDPSGGSNTFTGATTISAGILRIQQSGALGNPASNLGATVNAGREPSAGRQSADGSRGTERHQRGADPERHRVSQRRRPGKQPGRRQHSQPVGRRPSPWHPTPPLAPTPAPLCKSAAACKMPARSRSRP